MVSFTCLVMSHTNIFAPYIDNKNVLICHNRLICPNLHVLIEYLYWLTLICGRLLHEIPSYLY